jgi:hypothetical protein
MAKNNVIPQPLFCPPGKNTSKNEERAKKEKKRKDDDRGIGSTIGLGKMYVLYNTRRGLSSSFLGWESRRLPCLGFQGSFAEKGGG